MPVSKALGKWAAKVAKKDELGAARRTVEEMSIRSDMYRMKKSQLEDIAESGSKEEKLYAKQELKRRAEKGPSMSSDSMRDTIQKSVDRSGGAGNKMTPGYDEEFRKGGMVKKKAPAKKPAVKKPAVKKPMKKGK